MKNKRLILFTDSFPYGQGEQFLETEILFFSGRFQDITIVPSRIYGPLRDIPTAIKIETSLANQNIEGRINPSFLNFIQSLFKVTCSRFFYIELFSRTKSLIKLRGLTRMVSYLNYAIKAYEWLLSYIAKSNISLESSLFYTYWFSPVTLGLVLLKAKYPQIKIISRAHGADIYEERYAPPYLPFRKVMLKSVHQIFTISEHGKEYIIKRYNLGERQLSVSRLGVNDPGFETKCSNDGVFRIVSCSLLVPVKRINLLIDGIRVLSERRPDVALEWNHLGDGPLRAELEEKARNAIPSSVAFHFHGMLENNKIMTYYKNNAIDIFINVSESEGIPVSIMEAQSCGIPVIATMVGGVPEIVDNENGVLLKCNPTPIEIANALQNFIQINNSVLTKRKRSKLDWSKKYDAQINYNTFIENILSFLCYI